VMGKKLIIAVPMETVAGVIPRDTYKEISFKGVTNLSQIPAKQLEAFIDKKEKELKDGNVILNKLCV